MVSKLGIYSILIGGFVGVFSLISGFMNVDNYWVDLTLSTLVGEHSQTIVEAIPVEFIQNGLQALFYDLPLGAFFIGLGVFFFVISLFIKEH